MGCGASGGGAKKEEKKEEVKFGPQGKCPVDLVITEEELKEKGWYKRVLKEGNGKMPTKGKNIFIEFKGYTWEGGVCFGDSGGKPKECKAGKGLVKGMNLGCMEMAEEEEALIACAPDHGYGDKQTPGIPPGSILLFVVQMRQVE